MLVVVGLATAGISLSQQTAASAAPTGCWANATYVAMDAGWQSTSNCSGGNGHFEAWISCSSGYQSGNIAAPGGFGSFTPGCGLGAGLYSYGTALHEW